MQHRRASGGFVLALAVGFVGLGNAHCGGSNGGTGVTAPSDLTYAVNPALYTVGVAIAPNTPASSGGSVTSYAIAPALPAGLSLNTTTGVISGKPTVAAAAASYIVTATNSAGSATANVGITVKDVAPSGLTYSTNPAVYTVGTAITANVPSSVGTVASYSVAPVLPAGLSLNATSGVISGTPTAVTAAATYTITATNPLGSTTDGLSITVNDAPPTGLAYSANPAVYTKGAAITANTPTSGGGAVVSYSVTPALPVGLNLNTTTGVISGTPTAITATAAYTVTATNSGGSDTASVSITVNDVAPAGLTYTLNTATYTRGTAIAANSPTNSGGPVVSYSVAPALPAGLSLSTTSGVISGAPTVIAATASYTVTATNSGGSATDSISITVKDVPPTGLTYSANPVTYTKGTAIAANTPTSSGGPVVSYSVAPALPAGLSLSTSTGVISGTPTVVAAAANFIVTATNSGGSTTATVNITVKDAAPSNLVYSANPVTYTKGATIAPNTPTNSGGTIVAYSVAPALPAGLSLNTSTGVISGTPTALVATATYTVTGTNTGGTTTVGVSITVNDLPPTNLVYSANPATYTKGTAITPNTPTNSGGAIITYAVAPGLPTGLSLSTSTGVISGTPTAVTAMASYTVTGTNGVGNTTVSVTITVHDAAPTNLTYSANPATYTKGTAIAPNVPSSGGGTVVSYAVAPALPAGLALDTTSGVISGTPTTLTSTASFTVTATNAGGSATVSVSITVNDVAPANLTYSSNPATYTKGTAIAPNSPTSSGGPVVSYAVAPALPAGLSLSTTTGVISGTPTVVTAAANFVVTATNTGGSTTASVNITVKDIAPTNLVYSSNPATYTKGTAIAPNNPSSSGGAVISYAVAPALPAGLSLSTTTGVISGTPTVVTAAANFVVTATNTGGSTTASVNITVKDIAPSNLVYSSNPATYAKGTAIAPNVPSSSGGAVISYAVAPALPAGLSLSTTTGVISGTPTVVTAAANFVVTATNTGGSTTASVNITVNDTAPTSLVYSSNPATYTKGTAIAPNNPSSSGGAVVSYAVAPALPAGLSLSTSTGVISGTPTVVSGAANFVVTATNTGGSTTASVNITVNDIAPSNLVYSANPATYTKGTAIAPNNPSSSGGAVVSYAVAPALPAGLALNTASGVISGTPTVVSGAANFVVTATNTGGSTTAIVNITVNDIAPTNLVYSANPATYTRGTAIAPNNPSNSGGTPVSYSVAPPLPAGLALNTSTGVISGTPTAVSAAANFVVTATNTAGNTTASVNITVNDAAPTGLTYSANPASYTKGLPITANNPSNGGGAPVSYSVAPSLPTGLTLSTSTGFITGTPTVLMAASNFVVTATNTGGSTTVTLSITIKDVAPSGLTYSTNPAVYTVGTAIPQNVPSSAGGPVVSYSVSPTLPAGLAVSTTTGIISGTPTTVTSIANFTVTATNSGGSATASVSITVNVVSPTRFAFVANESDNTLSAYTVNANTGQLRANGYVATATEPRTVAVHPSGKFVYVANIGANTVSAYTINASSGHLTAIGSAVATGARPFSVTMDPKGRFAYVANFDDGTVSSFLVDGSTGALGTAIVISTGTNPSSVAADPTGRFAYVANQGGTVAAFSVSASTGAFTSLGALSAGTVPNFATVDPTGRFVYVTNQTAGGVSAFSIGATGALTSIGAATAGTTPTAVAVAPSGNFAYVANAGSNGISLFSINASTGALTGVGSPAAAPNPVSITIDPSGEFAYASNFNTNNVSVYSVNTGTGALTLLQTMGARPGATSFALGQGTAPVAYVSKFAYVANSGGNTVTAYTISGGALSRIGTVDVATGQGAASVAVDPTGSFAYVANQTDGTVSAYTIGSGGALTSAGTPISAGTGAGSISVAVDPSARFVYVANNFTGDVAAFLINSGGVLTSIGANVASGSAPFAIAVDPSGRFAYVANQTGASVAAFNIAANGALSIIGTSNVAAGNSPVSVAVDPSGRFVYVANEDDNTVSAFLIDPVSGALTAIGTPVGAGTAPRAVAVDPAGGFVYVANDGSNDVWTFSIGSNGALTAVGTGVVTGTATAPKSAAVDLSGSFVYTPNSATGDVTEFSIAGTGAITAVGVPVAAGSDPISIAISGIIQ